MGHAKLSERVPPALGTQHRDALGDDLHLHQLFVKHCSPALLALAGDAHAPPQVRHVLDNLLDATDEPLPQPLALPRR